MHWSSKIGLIKKNSRQTMIYLVWSWMKHIGWSCSPELLAKQWSMLLLERPENRYAIWRTKIVQTVDVNRTTHYSLPSNLLTSSQEKEAAACLKTMENIPLGPNLRFWILSFHCSHLLGILICKQTLLFVCFLCKTPTPAQELGRFLWHQKK